MRRRWILISLICMASASGSGQDVAVNPDVRIHTVPDSGVKKETIPSGSEAMQFNRESSNRLVIAMDSLANLEFAKPFERAVIPLNFNQPWIAFIPL